MLMVWLGTRKYWRLESHDSKPNIYVQLQIILNINLIKCLSYCSCANFEHESTTKSRKRDVNRVKNSVNFRRQGYEHVCYQCAPVSHLSRFIFFIANFFGIFHRLSTLCPKFLRGNKLINYINYSHIHGQNSVRKLIRSN